MSNTKLDKDTITTLSFESGRAPDSSMKIVISPINSFLSELFQKKLAGTKNDEKNREKYQIINYPNSGLIPVDTTNDVISHLSIGDRVAAVQAHAPSVRLRTIALGRGPMEGSHARQVIGDTINIGLH